MGGTPAMFDMSQAKPIGGATPLFDMSKAQPIQQTATPAKQAEPEGFWHSLGAQFGLTPEQLQAQAQDLKDHPVTSMLKDMLGPGGAVVKGLYDQGKVSIGDVAQAVKEYKQNPDQAKVDLVHALPIVGPAMVKAAQQTNADGRDSYGQRLLDTVTSPGAMGTVVGAAAQAAPVVAGAVEDVAPGALPAAGKVANAAINAPVDVGKRVALLGKTPEGAYESALKPSTVLSADQRAAVVKTGLENSIPVSKAGLEKIGDLITDYNQKIKDEIAADPNRPIDPNAVATRADSAKAKFAKQVNASGDLQAIEDSRQQFLKEQGAQNGNPAPAINAIDAQEMKQGTYRVLAGKFGEQGSASVEAQKALARGLKEEIATQFPEIAGLNAKESEFLQLQPILEKAVNRISNHQGIGIGTPIAGAAAKAVTGSGLAGGAASVLKAVFDNPAVKSRIAIAVSKGGKIPYGQAVNRVNVYAASLGSSLAAQQANSSGDNPNSPTTSQP